jgi:hypothetical protein
VTRPGPDVWLSAVIEDTALTPVQRAVAVALWRHMDRQGVCWPSMDKICDYSGCSKRDTVRAALDVLVERGWIDRSVQPKGRLSNNRYTARTAKRTVRRPVERVPVERVTEDATVTRLTEVRRPVERVTQGDPSNGSLTIHKELRGSPQQLATFLDEIGLRRRR